MSSVPPPPPLLPSGFLSVASRGSRPPEAVEERAISWRKMASKNGDPPCARIDASLFGREFFGAAGWLLCEDSDTISASSLWGVGCGCGYWVWI